MYDKEKKGRCEPVRRYTLKHILHQYAYLLWEGTKSFTVRRTTRQFPMLSIQDVDDMFSILVIKTIIMLFFITRIQDIEGMDMQKF